MRLVSGQRGTIVSVLESLRRPRSSTLERIDRNRIGDFLKRTVVTENDMQIAYLCVCVGGRLAFVRREAARPAETARPWFAYAAFTEAHSPYEAPPDYLALRDRSRERKTLANARRFLGVSLLGRGLAIRALFSLSLSLARSRSLSLSLSLSLEARMASQVPTPRRRAFGVCPTTLSRFGIVLVEL